MMTFEELGLKKELLSAVTKLGFVNPTPVQQQAIPHLLETQGDLIGLASTGTGKTAAFGLPMLSLIDTDSKIVQGLVLCPTRELCIQITSDLENYATDMRGVNIVPVYGGADIVKQIKQIQYGAQIVVATPGRLIDLIERKKIRLQDIQYVVLDEADEMLNMGFKEDIDQILEQTPDEKNVWLFSATMPKEVAAIAKNYMESPFEITVGGKNEGNKNIEHDYYVVKERDRYAALKRIIDFNPDIYGLIFCRTRRDTGMVADKLMADGYNAEPLHGDLSQAQRDRVMEKFRSKTLQILVATDVAARGIDVNDITHVVHYSLPEDVENYTHRSGRTARAGKKGISIALISSKEMGKIRSIERIIKAQFNYKQIPTADKICELQLMHLITKMTEVEVDVQGISKYMPAVMEKLEHLSKEEIIQRFVSTEFNRFLNYYGKSKNDLNADTSERGSDRERSRGDRDDRPSRDFGDRKRKDSRSDDSNFQRFFVNLGRRDGFNHGALLRLICDNTGINKTAVGKIDIMNNFSFFDADKTEAPLIMNKLKGIDFEGKEMTIEETKRGDNPADTGREEGFRKRKTSYGKSEGGYRRSEGGYRKSDDGFKKKSEGFRKGSSSPAYREKSEGAKERNKYKGKGAGADREGAPARKRSYKN
jgi:ATP-dependent RNA helicase DeaD